MVRWTELARAAGPQSRVVVLVTAALKSVLGWIEQGLFLTGAADFLVLNSIYEVFRRDE